MINKKLKLTAVVFSALIILSGTTFVLSQSAGPDGSFGYSVPIDVPPGVNGVQPKLSLEYNSNSGNGITGVGWSMEGIPSISRDTMYGIKYNSTDHYVSSDNGTLKQIDTSTVYHSEIECFSKFEAMESDENGAKYWRETKPDGSKLYYGQTSDSRATSLEHSGITYIWQLSRCEDTNGNCYDITYLNDNGVLYPDTITYGYNTAYYVITTYKKIQFNYRYKDEAKCENDYTYKSQKKRRGKLRSIDTFSGGYVVVPFLGSESLISTYNLVYQNDENNRVNSNNDYSINDSYLKKVTITSNGVTRTAGIFNYDNESSLVNNEVPTLFNNYNIKTGFDGVPYEWGKLHPGDYNGDGFTDLLAVANCSGGGHYIFISDKGKKFIATHGGWPSKSESAITGDFNGDGKDEVSVLSSSVSGMRMYKYNGSGLEIIWADGWPSKCEWGSPVDADGDGKSDIYILSSSVAGNWLYSWDTSTKLLEQMPTARTGWPSKDEGVVAGNFFGTSCSDIMAISSPASKLVFYKWDRDNNTYGTAAVTSLGKPVAQVIGDFNGDGLDDVFTYTTDNQAQLTQNNHLYISQGGDFKDVELTFPWLQTTSTITVDDDPPQTKIINIVNPYRDIYPGDYNGDGKTDLLVLYQNPSSAVIYYGGLEKFSDPVTIPLPDTIVNGFMAGVVGDFNGDGVSDCLIGNDYDSNGDNNTGIILEGKSFKGKLNKIINSIGAQFSITYELNTHLDGAILPDGNTYPKIANKSPHYLVTKLSTYDGRSASYDTTYSYYNGKTYLGIYPDTKDLGFQYITQKNEQTGERQTTYYEQSDYYSGGSPIKVETTNGSNQQTSIKNIIYNHTDTSYGTTSVQTQKEATDVYEAGIWRFQTSTTYKYDDYGNMTQTIANDGVNTITTDVKYDIDEPNWLLSRPKISTIKSGSKTLSEQSIEEYEGMNPKIKKVSYTDDNGNQKSIINSFTYFSEGRIETITDALGNTTDLKYTGNTTTIKDPLGHESSKEVDPATGKVTKETDANGHAVTTTYDSQGRVAEITDGSDLIKKVLYVNEGDPNKQYVETREFNTSTLGYVFSQSYYDGLGREYKQISLQQSADGGSSLYQITEKTYNSKGQLETQTGPYISADTEGINADNKYATTYEYDASNRVIKLTKETPKGDIVVSTSITKNGTNLQVVSTDPKGNNSTFIYDPRGKLKEKDEPEGGVISYEYDECGRLTTTTVNGLVTTIKYDSLGRRTSITDPDKGLTSYTYDDLGRVQTMTDAKNQTTTYFYDAAGRLTKEDNPDGTRDVNYSYDTSAYGINRLAQVSDGEVSTTYAYDIRGNVTSTNQIIDGYNFRFGMEYDMQNRVTKLTYPHGKDIRNLYSDTGSLAAVYSITNGTIGAYARYGIATADSYVSSSTAESDITKITSSLVTIEAIRQHQILRHTADGINTVIGYDPSTQRPTSLQSFYGNDSDKKWEDILYDYDKNGNIITINDTVKPAQNQTFAYDGINRLTSAQGVYGTEGYTYYTNGNLKTKGTKTLNYNNSHAHAVSSVDGGNSYTYDAAGNMITRGTDTLTYDAKNRMVSITNSTKTEDYVYDHSGQRVKKTRKDGTVIYSIGGLYELTIVPNNTPAHTMYIHGLKGDLIAQKTTADKTLMDNLAANSYLDGMNTGNTLKRWFYTAAYTLVKDRGLSRDIQKIAPWVFVGFGGLLLAFGMFNRFRYRGKQPIFKRLCADLVPLVLCVFISGTGLSACGSPTIADDTDDPIYTDAKATASPSPAAPAGTANTASASVTAAASANSTAASAASAASTQSVVTSTSAASTAASASASTGTTLSNGGTGLDSGGVSASSTDVTGIPIIGIFYFHPDHLGSVKYMTHPEASGTEPKEVWRTAYTPYGETVATQTSGSKTLHKTYTGQTDDLTDLMYYNARYYDPSIGRFITADDVVPDAMSSLSYDRYMYVDGNPINHSDPSGHSPFGNPMSGIIKSVIKIAINGIKNDAMNAIKNKWNSAKNWTKSAANSSWNWAKDAANSSWDWTKNAANSSWDWAKEHKQEIYAGIGIAFGGPTMLGLLGGIYGWAIGSEHGIKGYWEDNKWFRIMTYVVITVAIIVASILCPPLVGFAVGPVVFWTLVGATVGFVYGGTHGFKEDWDWENAFKGLAIGSAIGFAIGMTGSALTKLFGGKVVTIGGIYTHLGGWAFTVAGVSTTNAAFYGAVLYATYTSWKKDEFSISISEDPDDIKK